MRFPDWVDDPKNTPKKRAVARLRYLMTSLAVERTGSGTIRSFSRLVGVDHSTLAYSLKNGVCSTRIAGIIEEKLGRDAAPREFFEKPLEITVE